MESPGTKQGTENWDQVYEVLAAQPRRMVIFSLMNSSEECLSLPEAAVSSNQLTGSESLHIQLYHRHLPKLADAGYICWKDDPFCVQRGPHFEEPAYVIGKMTEDSDEHPERFRNECVVIGTPKEDDLS